MKTGKIGNIRLKNRIIRSASFEGMCDENGFPLENYFRTYRLLAKNSVGAIITGFTYIDKSGKAMQPGQAGMDSEDKIAAFQNATEGVHKYDCKIFMQLCHTGRQTLESVTGEQVFGTSGKKSFYYNQVPRILSTQEAYNLTDSFAVSALYAKQAGFDGIQIHAAHGYLVHQFLLKSINKRKDIFKINPGTGIGSKFLEIIINKIKEECGKDFPVLVKISAGDDYLNKFSLHQFIQLIKFLDSQPVDAIEVSYGTMDYALNIIRGSSLPVKLVYKYNPLIQKHDLYKKLRILLTLKKMRSCYNLNYSIKAKKHTPIPIICVGGIRKGEEINSILNNNSADFIGLARPLICEPDFVNKLREDNEYISRCTNCNICTVMCDSGHETRCYSN